MTSFNFNYLIKGPPKMVTLKVRAMVCEIEKKMIQSIKSTKI